MESSLPKQCRRKKAQRIKEVTGSRSFRFPSSFIEEGRTYRQSETVFISLPQVATGLR